jgi:hypothetical protein
MGKAAPLCLRLKETVLSKEAVCLTSLERFLECCSSVRSLGVRKTRRELGLLSGSALRLCFA